MKKTAIIIGGVALVGVVAYLYFKGKAKPNAETTGTGTTGTGKTGTDTTGTGTAMPPAGTVFTTPEEVEAITVKVATARDLTKTICDLKKQFKITTDEMNDFMNIFGNDVVPNLISGMMTAQELATYAIRRKNAVKTVAESINKLKELGYKEQDCKMVRIA
jgi:hypothetical protein